MRNVLINADDLNFTPGINKAITQLFEAEAISTTTAMMALTDPHFPDPSFITRFASRTGLHLHLTQGAPLTDLRRKDGRVLQTFPGRDQVDVIDPCGVEAEWTAQLERFQSIFTQNPCRVDSHHGMHRHPLFKDVAHKIANTLDIPIRCEKTENAPLVHEWTGQYKKAEALARMIKDTAAQSSGDIEVVVHPGLDMHELEGIDGWTQCRVTDYEELLRLKHNWNTFLPDFTLL